MTATALPSWTDYTASVGTEHATAMEDAGRVLGGLRIMDLGDGRIALDQSAVEQLQEQPEHADGVINEDETGGGLLLWIGGDPYPLAPAGD